MWSSLKSSCQSKLVGKVEVFPLLLYSLLRALLMHLTTLCFSNVIFPMNYYAPAYHLVHLKRKCVVPLINIIKPCDDTCFLEYVATWFLWKIHNTLWWYILYVHASLSMHEATWFLQRRPRFHIIEAMYHLKITWRAWRLWTHCIRTHACTHRTQEVPCEVQVVLLKVRLNLSL